MRDPLSHVESPSHSRGNPSEESVNRRNYFRAVGVVYLQVLRESDPVQPEHPLATSSQAPDKADKIEKLDEIGLKLMTLRSRIHYHMPENSTFFLDVIDILLTLDQSLKNSLHGALSITNRLAQRQSVIISGSGLEFITEDRYVPGESLVVVLTFPEYPYATVSVRSEVIRVEPHGTNTHRFRTAIAYENIEESDRELIIKYVNHLQRKKANPR